MSKMRWAVLAGALALTVGACAPETDAAAAAGAAPDQTRAQAVSQARPGGNVQGESVQRTPRVLHFIDLPPESETDRLAAQAGGTPIYVSDVRREARARAIIEDAERLEPGDARFEEILDELIEQRLLALEARRRGLHRDVEARRRLAAAEERILGNILVETAVSSAVTEEAVERVYAAQRDLAPAVEEVRARHILVSTRAEADEVALLLAQGHDFAGLARQISEDPGSRLEGGDLGWFTREGVLPALSEMAFNTTPGEVSSPFRTEYGWHVMRVENRRSQPRPDLDALRPNIVRFLTLEGIQSLLDRIAQTFPVTRTALPAPAELRRPAPEGAPERVEAETAPEGSQDEAQSGAQGEADEQEASPPD